MGLALSPFVTDAQAKFVLTHSEILSKIQCGKGQAHSLQVPGL
jgi:hypothetical protein